VVPNHQPKEAESVSQNLTFQNGKHSEFQGCVEKEQLYGQDRFEGRISDSTSISFTQEIPVIRLEGGLVPIQALLIYQLLREPPQNLYSQ